MKSCPLPLAQLQLTVLQARYTFTTLSGIRRFYGLVSCVAGLFKRRTVN